MTGWINGSKKRWYRVLKEQSRENKDWLAVMEDTLEEMKASVHGW